MRWDEFGAAIEQDRKRTWRLPGHLQRNSTLQRHLFMLDPKRHLGFLRAGPPGIRKSSNQITEIYLCGAF
jgi:hypothetical protein